MKHINQASVIKFLAVATASPRWVAALLAAEGLHIPAEWAGSWLIFSAVCSLGMAGVEGWAFAYIFQAYRNQNDKKAKTLLYWAGASAVVFAFVIAPYVAASVSGVTMGAILAGRFLLWAWSLAVAASTIIIVASVGLAQKEPRKVAEKTRQKSAESRQVPAEVPQVAAQVRKKDLTAGDWAQIAGMRTAAIAEEYSVSERTARDWRKVALNGSVKVKA